MVSEEQVPKLCRWIALASCSVWFLSGCFFDQLQRSEETDVQRVEQKQALLQAEQERSAALKQQEEQLATELGERQFTLSQLTDRVEKINSSNGRTLGLNEASRAHYEDLLAQVQSTNEQLTAARQSTTQSNDERRRRIEELKDRLRVQLDLLLR